MNMGLIGRIWLADDNKEDRELLRTAFERIEAENELLLFSKGGDLIDFLDAQEPEDYPSLIVLDLQMNGLGGAEVFRRIKDNPFTAKIAIVIFTSSADSDIKQMLKDKYGVYMVLEKGEDLNRLTEQARFFCELIAAENS